MVVCETCPKSYCLEHLPKGIRADARSERIEALHIFLHVDGSIGD